MTEQSTTLSISLDDLTLDELVQLSQGLGHQADKIREQRRYLAAKIAERVNRGERNGQAPAAAPAEGIDGVAPGALIETSLQG